MATAPVSTPDPNLDEMLRILDAASELRRERELVTEQLSVDEFRTRLRDRLLAAAAATGDPVEPVEVEAAIDTYFERMHAYEDPGLTPSVALAHFYVRRWAILTWGGLSLACILFGWWVFLRPSSPVGLVGGRERAVSRAWAEVDRDLATARALSADPEASRRIERLALEAATFRRQGESEKLNNVDAELDRLVAELESEYSIEVVHAPGKKSAVDRFFTDRSGKRISGYFLIVEGRDASGRAVELPIRSAETDEIRTLTTWGERVPKEVYDRLGSDKRVDGRLDEFVYGAKQRGKAGVDVQMVGPDGRPLERLGQITKW